MFLFCLFSRTQCRLVVKGLGVVGSSGSQRNPDLLKARLMSVLSLIGSPTPFSIVNVLVYPTRGSPVYDVELSSVESVNALIREFSKYTRRRDPVRRPSELDRVSIYHSVTPGTRVRVSLLRVRLLVKLWTIKRSNYLMYLGIGIIC